ncbi:class I SAM-dependent methyltransferase [Proteus mirabilis]|nr:class I SAM-dependent methyltransferase [Proteus mirabilis]MBG6049041.1 class I SAM-dependent methyltransferase [Proteus mirabilis]
MKKQDLNMRNWFTAGGENYARYRPVYPDKLASYLASIAPDRNCALDVGCGTGQLTRQLARYFAFVKGVDPSANQLSNAEVVPGVSYECSPAESLPLQPSGYSLITAAQAAHWFKLSDFYSEVRRVAAPDAVIALISYGVLQLDDALNERFRHFYYDQIFSYWPAERQLVDNGYNSIDFPFNELASPRITIELDWDFEAFAGYISTWSAVVRALEAGEEKMLREFCEDMAELWGDISVTRTVTWPLNMRAGRI